MSTGELLQADCEAASANHRAGEVFRFSRGEQHWHGAILANLGGKVVDWMEKVNAEEYHKDSK